MKLSNLSRKDMNMKKLLNWSLWEATPKIPTGILIKVFGILKRNFEHIHYIQSPNKSICTDPNSQLIFLRIYLLIIESTY